MPFKNSNLNCKLHNHELKVANARIGYGFRRYSEEFIFASTNFFPNSNFIVSGGCCIPDKSEHFQKVRYCSVCRDCHLAWAKEHNSAEGLAPTEKVNQ